ncbi:DUF998 domain-containing protein [Nonomuraea sp. bgisy101]|uniref:DUF998 domain-containing protein n=1 Tax=Nonomuraea sp. bgisy101 TaxID=3413784 RepID=UPI003D742DC5
MTDPALGYPAATPAVASLGGSIHNLTSPIVFIALPAACFVLVRRFARDKWRGWASYSIATGTLAVVFFMLFFANVSAANGQDRGDLASRAVRADAHRHPRCLAESSRAPAPERGDLCPRWLARPAARPPRVLPPAL